MCNITSLKYDKYVKCLTTLKFLATSKHVCIFKCETCPGYENISLYSHYVKEYVNIEPLHLFTCTYTAEHQTSLKEDPLAC